MEDTKYLPELLAEKDSLDSSFTHAMKLITAGNAIISCVMRQGFLKKKSVLCSYLDINLSFAARPEQWRIKTRGWWTFGSDPFSGLTCLTYFYEPYEI